MFFHIDTSTDIIICCIYVWLYVIIVLCNTEQREYILLLWYVNILCMCTQYNDMHCTLQVEVKDCFMHLLLVVKKVLEIFSARAYNLLHLIILSSTVEPLVKDTQNKGNLSIKDKTTHPNSYYT